jgi:hypothetical protein
MEEISSKTTDYWYKYSYYQCIQGGQLPPPLNNSWKSLNGGWITTCVTEKATFTSINWLSKFARNVYKFNSYIYKLKAINW